MSEPLRFPEYGQAGDTTGTRRARRAFRFFVLLCLGGTFSLWMAENYLRYDLGETQYRAALIHHPASARPILRKVVSRDAAEHEIPNVRYLEALAFVEEEDRVIPAYAETFKHNSNDPNLLVKYGVELYLAGNYGDARERFREAGIEPPDNALPHFLETAAMVASTPELDNLAGPLAVLDDGNPDVNPVLFPVPMWHASWPRDGAWYWDMQRALIDRCLAPLYRLVDDSFRHLQASIRGSGVVVAQDWLTEIEGMGAGLVGTSDSPVESLGLSQALAGLEFQRRALELRIERNQGQNLAPDSLMLQDQKVLLGALDQLKAFDEKRQQWIVRELEARKQPISLAFQALLLVGVAYILASAGARITGGARKAWGLPHSRLAIAVLSVMLLAIFGLLCLTSFATNLVADANGRILLERGWLLVIAIAIAFSFIFPLIVLPRAEVVAEKAATPEADGDTLLPMARRARRLAHMTLLRRYCGILLGGLLCVYAAWFVGFRIVEAHYPYQVELLVSGYRDAEISEIRAVQARLR